MRIARTYTLSVEDIARLDELAELTGESRSAVLSKLIQDAKKPAASRPAPPEWAINH